MSMQKSRSSYSWETLHNLPNAPCPRSSHQLSSVGSRIYLFGGENGPPQSHFGYGLPVASTAVHCLDLDLLPLKGWKEMPVTRGTPPSPRLGHGQSVVVDDQKTASLYVFGGRQPLGDNNLETIRSLNDLHRFDIESGVWEEIRGATGDIPSERSYHQMVAVGHSLFVFAGMVQNDRYKDLYQFDARTHHWSQLPSAPTHMEGRGGPGLCAIQGGPGTDTASLIVVAGFCGRPMADVWEYRIATQQWIPRRDWTLPVPRSIFACGALQLRPTDGVVETIVCTFGGELENYDAALVEQGQDPTLQASLYTNETLLLSSTTDKEASGSVRVLDVEDSPLARGWTAGCSAIQKGNPCFVVFGGVREGREDEPSGVRLGDLSILHVS